MAVSAYLFEVRSIQPFLFATGKLKDMVKGSELIDFLCNEPLQLTLEACGLENHSKPEHSPRCAGGSFYLLIKDSEKAVAFRNLWTLLVSQLLPGVELVDTLVSGESARDAIQNGLNQLRIARNQPTPQLPAASPLAARSPRTGRVSVELDRGESLDEATSVKRQFVRPNASKDLATRFSSHHDLRWPINFEADSPEHLRFPLAEGDKVALVHADGNGLGEILRLVNEAGKQKEDAGFIALYRQFSDGLEQATIEACQEATDRVLVPEVTTAGVVPARPLVLGGDDLTVIVRADLALDFTQVFIQSFEEKTQLFLKKLALQLPGTLSGKLPEKLTACAGIAFMRPSQPFAQCYALAESLCDRAKKQSRAVQQKQQLSLIPSSLAFHKIQVSLIEDADQMFEREMKVKSSSLELQLGLSAYAVSEGFPELPSISDLQALSCCFQPGKLNDKRLRALATLMHVDPAGARNDYARWRTLAARNPGTQPALKAFDAANQRLLGNMDAELPANLSAGTSVIADLLTYLSLTQPWKKAPQGEAVL
ncbi:MAG: hypothetical protein IBX50_14370 [Marinospirillum sp.]|uniref:Cas10/Cmr2 second palm domain-containing protein n=1 Tax=Marinospirillum sp. TaxID=2183934 RepID=UPI001A01C3D6|nr:hypothetical protein [Marinospirillum sp.]MBE0507873.1 hypothetical protein [Marinospirillum sp.]